MSVAVICLCFLLCRIAVICIYYILVHAFGWMQTFICLVCISRSGIPRINPMFTFEVTNSFKEFLGCLCFLGARYCCKYFTFMNSFNSHT